MDIPQEIDFFLPGTCYSEFLHNEMPADIEADICMDVSFGVVHDIKNMRDCFETGQSWSLFREGDNYLITFQMIGSGKPYLTARTNNDFSTVELFCGNELVNGKGKMLSLVLLPLVRILLMHYLSGHEGVIAHSAGMSFNGNGYLFPGCSGAGKTTISKTFANNKKMILLSDDRIITRKVSDTFMIYGTPWPGDAGIAVNKSAPLKGVFFLEKGFENIIKQIDQAGALRRFMSILSVPWYDRDSISKTLSLVGDLTFNVPSYVLYFKPGQEVVDKIEKFVPA